MFELRLQVPHDLVEPVSDALMDALDALSVSVEDLDADTDQEKALYGEPGLPAPAGGWNRSILCALFAQTDQATEAATLLKAQDWTEGLVVLDQRPVEDQDWVRLTQSQFTPVAVTPDFWIVPTWHDTPEAARTVIRLDPGMAFGTGTHPTTRMCLAWTATQAAVQGQKVLDYGCGSGILAIGAALHGAVSVDAVDIDPDAVQATQDNAQANQVQATVKAGLPDAAHGVYGVVLANILATPLKMLAPLLCAHVAPGGHLVLAGILSRQAEELQAAYAPWMRLQVFEEQDGWILMAGQKPSV